mgnify:CR=1 FL=1
MSAQLLELHGVSKRFERRPNLGERIAAEGGEAMPTTPESTALSKELKDRGWTFVGPTTAYAFMQAMGLVNDHLDTCDARAEVERRRAALRRPR